MKLGKLTHSEFKFLINALNENKGMSEAELIKLNYKHPYVAVNHEKIPILSCKKTYYGFHNKQLNNFLMSKFGKEDLQLDFFYKLDYGKGQFTLPHKDQPYVLQTTLVLLSEDFTGGVFNVDNSDLDFNKKGQFVNFLGNQHVHSVSEVKSGLRSVLVVMFNKKSSLI